jgi:hypothetical protein
VHTGSLVADGVCFAVAGLGRDEVAHRLAAAWQRGSRVYDCAGLGVLLIWPAPRRVRSERLAGAPVRRFGAGFAAAPESLLGPPPDGCLLALVLGGAPRRLPLVESRAADWLDLPAPVELALAPLVADAPPAAPRVPPPAPEARGLLGVAAADPERAGVLAALDGRPEAAAGPTTGGAASWWRRLAGWLRPAGAGAGRGGAPWWRRLAGWLRPAGAAGGADRAAPLLPAEPRESRLGAWLSRLLMRSRLGRLLGHRQAEYLARTMALLEGGDLEEGLRRAIPLANAREAARRARPALGLPGMRTTLAIRLGPRGSAGTSYVLEESFFSRMEKLYRATFARLDAQGRSQEAAFVLAELLQADEEAVAYLERKGELRLSAELAEARRVAPGLIVRQWFLAGERARAVAVARRYGAFPDAVVRLERTDPARATALRMIWADALAGAGHLVAAIDVAWRIPEMRALVRRWIEDGLAPGGPSWIRLLARKLALDDARWEEARPHVEAVLAGDGPDDARQRLELAAELVARPGAALTAFAARPLLRRLYADHSRQLLRLEESVAAQLARAADDRALAADRPAPSQRARPALKSAASAVELVVDESGSTPIHDAVAISRTRFLLALGDAGVRLVDDRGKTLAHFEEPAHRLVASDDGGQVLLLAERGRGFWRLGRLDLRRRATTAWCDAALRVFARSFDGDVWFAATDERLCAVDTHAPDLLAFWSVSFAGEDDSIIGLARDPARLTMLSGGWGPCTRWTYELPTYVLRARNELPAGRPLETKAEGKQVLIVATAVSPAGAVARLYWEIGSPELVLLVSPVEGPALEAEIPVIPEVRGFDLELDGSWIVCIQQGGEETIVDLLDASSLRRRFRARLAGSGVQTTRRLQGERLIVSDARGRLLAVDLDDGRVAARIVI